MIQCQNCGQVNNYGSNFCRFCGTRMVMTETRNQNATPYENYPPRPYVWKTDEFQLQDTAEKKPKQINQVQPLSNPTMQNQRTAHPLMMPPPSAAHHPYQQQSQQIMNYGYRCPRCGTQNFPLVTRKISSAGWIVFAVLLVMFFPLFWIGFLIKEDVKICPVCNTRVG